ncbi:myb-related transcription factor, partner of profilin-like [Argopecten irradians]|uniref:myb-related transcription factor, partner of profilin-like n=1 Tax=Argopecten irradians TaxID=31199 RepID=UPI00371B4314
MVEVEKRLSRTIIPGPIFPVICQIGTCHLSNDVTCVVCIYRVDADSGARMMATKRGTNWTEREKVVLVEEVVKREAVLFGKFHGTSVTSETKQTAWEAVAAGVNAIAQVPKTVDQVKKQYSNIKQRAKETVDSLRKTGGGPRQEATQSQALLLENIGSRPEVIGLPVNLDTEDTNYSEETCVLKPACPESPVPGSSKSMVSQKVVDLLENLCIASRFRTMLWPLYVHIETLSPLTDQQNLQSVERRIQSRNTGEQPKVAIMGRQPCCVLS